MSWLLRYAPVHVKQYVLETVGTSTFCVGEVRVHSFPPMPRGKVLALVYEMQFPAVVFGTHHAENLMSMCVLILVLKCVLSLPYGLCIRAALVLLSIRTGRTYIQPGLASANALQLG